MNGLILLLLLCGCGNQNNCGDASCNNSGRRREREDVCDEKDECGTRDRERSGSCDCKNDERNDSRECGRFDGDGARPSSWRDFPDLNRGENCGCEENNRCDNK